MAHGASTHSATPEARGHYAVPQPMAWPIMGSASLFMMALGGVLTMNGMRAGWISIAAGFMLLLYMMVRWFGDVIRESEGGKYSRWEDVSFRWGMSFFIFSEVMFFAAFFGALFWARVYSVPDLATIESNALVWPGFTAHWPSAGPNFSESFSPMGAWGLPALNTVLLLTSGVTITFAHWNLLANNRGKLILWLGATIALGVAFLICQAIEYVHAFEELNLHRVSLRVYTFNERAMKSYAKLGFVEEGRLRQAMFRHGAWHDVVLMAILADEWFEKHGRTDDGKVLEAGRK